MYESLLERSPPPHTFISPILNGTSASRCVTNECLKIDNHRAHFILIIGTFSSSLRHVLRWAVELSSSSSASFSSSSPISSISSSTSSPLYLGVSSLIALGKGGGGGDPASWLMVTPPQLVTSKRGHCAFCFPLLLIQPIEELFAQ